MGHMKGHQFGRRDNQDTKNTHCRPHSLCHVENQQKSLSITNPIIWLNCFDARSVHWLHSYHRPSVVAGGSHCRYRCAVVRFCERNLGVVSEANERSHVRITLAKRVDAAS